MDLIIKKLKENQLFRGLNEEEIKKIFLCSNSIIQNFADNQVIFEKDDKVNNVGIVMDGELNLVSQKYNGTRVIVTTLTHNDLFGEALIFSSEKTSPYDLVSACESKALFIPYSFFVNTCKESCNFHKKLISNFLTILSDKIIMLNNKMKILNSESIKQKIAVYLLSLYKKTNSTIFDMPMKRQEMSEFLNTTRPSLSRELSKLQEEKIIEVYKSTVKILNLEALYELSE